MSYVRAVAADTPLGYWRLGELAGTLCEDCSGNNRDGTYTGSPTLAATGGLPIDPDKACTFDGTNDHVTMGDVAAFEFTAAFSVEFLIKTNTTPLAPKAIVGKISSTTGGWGLNVDASGRVQFFAYTSAMSTLWNFTSPSSVVNNAWHHVVCTWDGTTNANGVKIYVDGAVVAQATKSAGALGSGNTVTFKIGASDDVAANFFQGTLDEVAVYSGALGSTRVTAHYTAFSLSIGTDAVVIDDVDRLRQVDRFTINAADNYQEQANTLSFFTLGLTPAQGAEVILVEDGRIEFWGTIVGLGRAVNRRSNRVEWNVRCNDAIYDAAGTLITAEYTNDSATDIARALFDNAPAGFTTVHVEAGLPTVDAIQFKMQKLPDALAQLADAIGAEFRFEGLDCYLFLDENGDLPDDLNTSNTDMEQVRWDRAKEEVKNVIEVEGGGGTAQAEAAPGATELHVDSGNWYDDAGGEVIVGNQILSYSGKSADYDRGNARWRAHSPAQANDWHSICWSPELSLFVAVSISGTSRVMTSPDGETWTARSAAQANSWRGVCWASALGLFVAVASDGSSRVMTSPDGITWTARTASEANQWWGVEWSPDLAQLVAVSIDGTHQVMTSTDGINWTNRSPSTTGWIAATWAHGLSLWVAVSINGLGGTSSVMTSPDGVTWTNRTAASLNAWRSVAWSEDLGLLVACSGGSSSGVMTSPNGTTWTTRTVTASNPFYDVFWSDEVGLFCIVGTDTTSPILTSEDGIAWTVEQPPSSGLWRSVTFSPALGKFVAVGITGSVAQVMSNESTVFAILTGIPSSGDGSIQYTVSAGEQVNVFVTDEDAASIALYQRRRFFVQDRRLTAESAAVRAAAELRIRSGEKFTGSYLTTDYKAKTGRPLVVDMAADWGIDDEFIITQVTKGFDPTEPEMQRRVTWSSARPNDLYRVMRKLQRDLRAGT